MGGQLHPENAACGGTRRVLPPALWPDTSGSGARTGGEAAAGEKEKDEEKEVEGTDNQRGSQTVGAYGPASSGHSACIGSARQTTGYYDVFIASTLSCSSGLSPGPASYGLRPSCCREFAAHSLMRPITPDGSRGPETSQKQARTAVRVHERSRGAVSPISFATSAVVLSGILAGRPDAVPDSKEPERTARWLMARIPSPRSSSPGRADSCQDGVSGAPGPQAAAPRSTPGDR